eukprot:Rmarinus@m.3803
MFCLRAALRPRYKLYVRTTKSTWASQYYFCSQPFVDLGLSRPVADAALRMGYKKPTDVQIKTITEALEGNHVLVSSATGTGKTASYALPLLHAFDVGDVETERLVPTPSSVVVVPTRVLRDQIYSYLVRLSESLPTPPHIVPVDASSDRVVSKMPPTVDIVVTTPQGAVIMCRSGHVDLGGVNQLVLDECDKLLGLDFLTDMKELLGYLPPPWDASTGSGTMQTYLLSATILRNAHQLASEFAPGYSSVPLNARHETPPSLSQVFFPVIQSRKLSLLLYLAQRRREAHLSLKGKRVLIFTRTKDKAEKIARSLNGRLQPGRYQANVADTHVSHVNSATQSPDMRTPSPSPEHVNPVASESMPSKVGSVPADPPVFRSSSVPMAACLHANMSFGKIRQLLKDFEEGRTPYLVTTDVLARGIDIPSVDVVVNVDLPVDPEDYVHRVGRTARQGAKGTAISMVAPHPVISKLAGRARVEIDEFRSLSEIGELVGKSFPLDQVPGHWVDDEKVVNVIRKSTQESAELAQEHTQRCVRKLQRGGALYDRRFVMIAQASRVQRQEHLAQPRPAGPVRRRKEGRQSGEVRGQDIKRTVRSLLPPEPQLRDYAGGSYADTIRRHKLRKARKDGVVDYTPLPKWTSQQLLQNARSLLRESKLKHLRGRNRKAGSGKIGSKNGSSDSGRREQKLRPRGVSGAADQWLRPGHKNNDI